MCYGMGCMYEDCRGECKCRGINPPSDAACMEGEEDLYDPFIDDDDDSGEEDGEILDALESGDLEDQLKALGVTA